MIEKFWDVVRLTETIRSMTLSLVLQLLKSMDVKIRKLAVDSNRKGNCVGLGLFNHTLLLCFFIKGGECLHTGCTGSDGLIDSHVHRALRGLRFELPDEAGKYDISL